MCGCSHAQACVCVRVCVCACVFVCVRARTNSQKMAAHMAHLTMCDSSDEEIVAVVVCVAGSLLPGDTEDDKEDITMPYMRRTSWEIPVFDTRVDSRRPPKQHDRLG